MFQRLFAVSRWLHRYLGLVLFLYLALEGVTGILLNHPGLISGLAVPRWLVPPSYRIGNWSRGSLRTAVFSERDPKLGFFAGSEGVWKTSDGGVTFEPLESGYPRSSYHRRTNHVLLLEDAGGARLWAATRGGLYECDLKQETWRPVELGGEPEEVRKILLVDRRLVVFTPSHAYESAASTALGAAGFRPVSLARAGGSGEDGFRLVTLMAALHGGEIWGLPGRLLIDLVGAGLVFLSLSGVYVWYFPRALRWSFRGHRAAHTGDTRQRRAYRWLYKYHLDLGVWATLFLIVIAGTALCLPPSPLVSLTARTTVSRGYWPGPLPTDPWHESIGNATYDSERHEIVIESKGSLWRGPADFSGAFTKDPARLPVGAMGTNVMEATRDGLLVGSFSGLYLSRLDGGPPTDLRTGKPSPQGTPRRPVGDWQVAGYFETPAGERFVATHNGGLTGIGDARPGNRFQPPDEMIAGYRMPLWSFLFEIHNGRILRDWMGRGYFLISLVGAGSLLVISLTGLYDWAYRKSRVQRRAAAADETESHSTPTHPEGAVHHATRTGSRQGRADASKPDLVRKP